MSIVFGNAQSFTDDQDGIRTEYMPTLLHFSAMYGLRDLTAALLQCPGAVHAYGTANCDGDYPTHLAEKSGHWELTEFMHTYMEVAAMVHDDYGETFNMQTSQIMSSMVYGQYLSFAGEVAIPEDIYVPIAGGATNLNTPVGYVAMHPAGKAAGLPQAVDYDFMIKRMLESNPDDPEKDYEELDVSPTLLPPERRLSSVLTGKVSDPPPLPPPRDQPMPKPGLDPGDAMADLLPNIHTNLSAAQEELISLQKKVKNQELTINQAVFRFKEWERKHKERAASFQYQQENLQRIRTSLMRSREERRKRGDSTSIKISDPIIAGSSTYDKVLLKTRKEVMIENANAYGGVNTAKPAPKRPSFERNQNAAGNEYSKDGGCRGARTSFKNKSIGRPPVPSPSSPVNMNQRLARSSLGSQGSSSSSRSSGRSIGGEMPPMPSPRPMGRLGRSSVSDLPPSHPSPFNQYHPGGWGAPPPPPEEPSPPPLPPRDDTYSAHARQRVYEPRPAVPPRSPVNR